MTSAERQRRYRQRKAAPVAEIDADPLLALLEQLPRIWPTEDGPYNYTDRARDFLQVFNTDQGRRVLAQIGQFCDQKPSRADTDKPGRLAFDAGKRWVLAAIQAAMIARKPVTIEKET